MLAMPSKTLPADDGHWAYEMKWDGMRALVVVERRRRRVRITSRGRQRRHRPLPRARRHRRRARGVDAAARRRDRRPRRLGVPSFERLQPRMQAHGSTAAVRGRVRRDAGGLHGVRRAVARRATPRARSPTPNGGTLLERLEARRARTGRRRRRRSGDGAAVLDDQPQLGLEGVVAKRLDSTYLPGPPRRRVAQGEADARPGARGRRLAPRCGSARGPARFAARRLPRRRGDRRAAVRGPGRVGHRRTTRDASSSAPRAAAPRDEPVRRGAEAARARVWVEPSVVVEVAFHEWTERRCAARAPLPRHARRQARRRRRARDAERRRPGYRRPHGPTTWPSSTQPRRPARPRRRGHAARAGRRRARPHRRAEPRS